MMAYVTQHFYLYVCKMGVISCAVFLSVCVCSKPDMSRLRLAAGCAILRLAQEPCYNEIITLEQYQLCALVINVRPTTGSLSGSMLP